MGFFGGNFLVQGCFWVLLEALGIFFWVWTFGSIQSPSLEIPSTPTGSVTKCFRWHSAHGLLSHGFFTLKYGHLDYISPLPGPQLVGP